MGVDVSIWRARVGMFTLRTSQKSLLIFRAQNKNKPSSYQQAPCPITNKSMPCHETGIRESRSIQQDDCKPNSAQPAHQAYSQIVWVLFSYILLFFVLLVDSPLEPRPPPSCPPPLIYPDQNETSPMQLSHVQLLMILICGDVEVNPGPPSRQSFADRATELTNFTVPVEDVNYPEYCSKIDVDFTLKRKDRGYMKQMEDIVQTVCSMLNYAGGIIKLNPKTANNDKHLDEWVEKIQQQLDLVVQKEILMCIEMKRECGEIDIWLKKSWKFITYKLSLYIRRGNGTLEGDISMISGGSDTKPVFVSKVAGILWQQLNYGDQFTLSEGIHLEFKCYDYESTCDATTLMTRIANDEIRGEPKLVRTLLAFTNTEGGGDVIIGIKEDAHGVAILQGQNLPAADEGEIRKFFNELMIKGLNGEQRIWPSTPNGSEWTINFYPLRNCRINNRHVLIHIRVNQIAGYVLGDEPEAYTMTTEGKIRHVPLKEWKNRIKPGPASTASKLLTLSTQSEKLDNEEDDTDEEQFKQLMSDLKSHRVTLSLKHIKSASWTKDSEEMLGDTVMKPGVNMHTCVEDVSKSELLMPSCPTTWVPDKPILDRWVTNNRPDIKQCVDAIDQSYSQEAVVIGTKCYGYLFPRLSLEVPQNHAFDFFVLQGNGQINLWIVFDDYTDTIACKKYTNSAIRKLRSQLLSYMHQHTDTKAINLVIRAKVLSIADNCIKYETKVDCTESTVELPVLQKAVAYCLLQGQSHIRNRLGEGYLTALTKDQLSAYLHYEYMTVLVFQGPPGSGKSIIAQHLCDKETRDRNLSPDKILYISPCQPLAEFMRFQGKCEVKFTKSKKLAHTIKEALKRGILLIIVDDAHLFRCSKHEWLDLVKRFEPRDKGSAEIHLAIFLDPQYQNFQHDKSQTFFEAISLIYFANPFSYVQVCRAFPVMIRNSRNIFTFFKQNAEQGSFALACSHDFQGDGVSVSYISGNFFSRDINNPVIRIIKEIVGKYNFEEGFIYQVTDITILVDSDGRGKAEDAVQMLHKIFDKFYPEVKVHRASQFPVQGIVIEELRSFSGLDTRVCILVLTSKNTSIMDNPRYKCFVASRGITKLVFLLHGDTVDSSFRQLKFSEEKQWQKLTKQLLKEIPEKGSSEEWLRANVPDTECWHKAKPFVIMRCQQQIQLEDHEALAEWVDRNITPALRQDVQYVRAVIQSVCERTIQLSDHQVDSAQLRAYLGTLNCLYGAPQSLQLQVLDSLYDLVESQQHNEEVLNQILDIMWYDGHINRNVILSWYDNDRKACLIKMQGKDLGEQIQELIRARQDVKIWITSQMNDLNAYQWYDLAHYQRVVLHALCEVAVTWQGDKCKVDKDLLLDYISELFSPVGEKIQLLYAVQCVLHHLQNPPGLAVAVFQAVLAISILHTVDTGAEDMDTKEESLITHTVWDKWRNTQNPAYEEGRNIIQQKGQLLDLIVCISSEHQTLTDINGWISANIPQDQMHDAFIITIKCLLNRGQEVALVSDWISQNVPPSMEPVVQDTLKRIKIQQCLHEIQFWGYSGRADRVDTHILPAWRQDAHFVRAVIQAVCETTINSDHKIHCTKLRRYLGSLNCLYGAPEALQFQTLDSVYDHVRILQNHENILGKFLDIMCCDGYISRQTMLSWFGHMDQAISIKFKGISADSKKDLGELLQERLRARQEVMRWIEETTQIIKFHSFDWYNCPHYQRVVLHALCELAVTWQGDNCTVDKCLLFHYITHLFQHVEEKIQLLYAVQCVLHHLQNPPGLAVVVLQAVLTISIPDTENKPLITATDWHKWRQTQNPAYEEGRHIIQHQGMLLDLVVIVRSEHQPLTGIKGWIAANIRQDQMLDAFIIAAECLLNKGEEVVLVRDWISQNVPESMQTVVQDTLKPFVIMRCQQQIQLEDPRALAEWVDRNITPALRQDAQYVRAVMRSVCERTIQLSDHQVDSAQLRAYLGTLNCLYGAPQSLQLQVLDSLYDLVESQQHPEEVLNQILDIMWYDGHISRKVILSWYGNMDQTKRQACEIGIQGKNLGEEIQTRMSFREDVKKWMGVVIQLIPAQSHDWYDLAHFQRVALNALCKLAITEQCDKSTVDKNLLSRYIQELFCDVDENIQLLYAVQCVLHNLQNPPGLAVAVLQAVLTTSHIKLDTEEYATIDWQPLITTTDWDKWRNTQNPAYEEGRDIIRQKGQLLDLIVKVRSERALTEVKCWISANISQDQIPDAFIIATECLLNRGEEVALIWDWISQNVPHPIDTAVQDMMQTIIIQKIPSRADSELISWMDMHILPAWRQKAPFVRAVIKALCERTIYVDYKIDCTKLRIYLASLNCLYGASDALQLQALNSVYKQFATLHNHEKNLKENLHMMWYDGYINRQVIQSWIGTMDLRITIQFKGNLDLGEQLQQRMKKRQNVQGWMEDTTQIKGLALTDWYNFPHYQRVTLHALCQLAVECHGGTCTVDKDLLLRYIPHLFQHVKEKMQLLYAVQCVVYRLHNPPGLAEFVLQALVSHELTTNPIMTESHLVEWRQTENPAYEEGRESMLQIAENYIIYE